MPVFNGGMAWTGLRSSLLYIEVWLRTQRGAGWGHGQWGNVTALPLQASCTCTPESPRRRDRGVSLCYSSAALGEDLFALFPWSGLQNQSCPWFRPVPASLRMTEFTSKDYNAPVSVTNYCSSTAPLWITVATKMSKQTQDYLRLLS